MSGVEDHRDTRRAIEHWESPYLVRLGEELRILRLSAGMSQVELATKAGLGERGLRRLEHGERRTRASTLTRLAGALTEGAPAEVTDRVATALMAVAGPTLAPESQYAERVQRRRDRRRRAAARTFVTEHVVSFEATDAGVVETHLHRRRVSRRRTRDRIYRILRAANGRWHRLPPSVS